jgi:hypothetical protein
MVTSYVLVGSIIYCVKGLGLETLPRSESRLMGQGADRLGDKIKYSWCNLERRKMHGQSFNLAWDAI